MQMGGKISHSHWAAPDCVHAACECPKHKAGRSWFLTRHRRAVDRNPKTRCRPMCVFSSLLSIHTIDVDQQFMLTGKRAEAAPGKKKKAPAWYQIVWLGGARKQHQLQAARMTGGGPCLNMSRMCSRVLFFEQRKLVRGKVPVSPFLIGAHRSALSPITLW